MNYNSLINKPTINYRELIGDNTVSEVGGITEEEFNTLMNTDLASYYTKEQIDELFARSYVYREKSGSIVTFDCPASVNGIDKVVSKIVAVQSGTGDPSPENKRPIIGHTEANATKCGKNLLGGKTLGQVIVDAVNDTSNTYLGEDTDGKYVTFTGASAIRNKIFSEGLKFKENTKYSFVLALKRDSSSSQTVATNLVVYYTDGTESQMAFPTIPTLGVKTTFVYTTAQNKTVANFGLGFYSGKIYMYYDESGIFEGTITAEKFEPYSGTTYTTALKDGQGNPMTCYGGTLSNENGVQVLDNGYGYAVFDGSNDENWQSYSGSCFTIALTNYLAPSSSAVSDISANYLRTVNKGSQGETQWLISGSNPNTTDIMINIGKTTVAEVREYLAENPLQVKYILATPTQIPQDNLPISTQDGTNNIWCDSGDITVKALDKILQG